MRRYETVYILRPNLGENEINTIIDNTNEVIQSDGGKIINLDRWGMRKLAYLIKKETLGYYVFCDYATDPKEVSEIERKFRIDDSVLRYMTIKLDDSITAEEIEIAIGEYEASKAVEKSGDDESQDDSEQEVKTETKNDDE